MAVCMRVLGWPMLVPGPLLLLRPVSGMLPFFSSPFVLLSSSGQGCPVAASTSLLAEWPRQHQALPGLQKQPLSCLRAAGRGPCPRQSCSRHLAGLRTCLGPPLPAAGSNGGVSLGRTHILCGAELVAQRVEQFCCRSGKHRTAGCCLVESHGVASFLHAEVLAQLGSGA